VKNAERSKEYDLSFFCPLPLPAPVKKPVKVWASPVPVPKTHTNERM